MKIRSIMWNSHIPMLVRSARKLDFLDLKAFSSKTMENDPSRLEEALRELRDADIILLYRSSEGFWDTVEEQLKEIGQKVPIVCISYDPSFWYLSTVRPEVVSTCYSYVTIGGEDNFVNMLCYLAKEMGGMDVRYESPQEVPWEGLYHPRAGRYFRTVEDYLAWYKPKDRPSVGILFSRFYWVNDNLEVENALIEALEKQDLNVIPVFSYSVKDENLGAKGSGEVVREVFLTGDGTLRVQALVKLQTFFLGKVRGDDLSDAGDTSSGVGILKALDVPVFQPITAYSKDIEEWEKDAQGLSTDIGWSVALPEFEGVIEPVIIGAARRSGDEETGVTVGQRAAIRERC
ncbi:MAG: cobaltochelatase subunit CobN, partial [Deltaproteobacteria bacterium]|nr:cobaltochelatase subunit CobN [Deltaproteobacteria bacterium]